MSSLTLRGIPNSSHKARPCAQNSIELTGAQYLIIDLAREQIRIPPVTVMAPIEVSRLQTPSEGRIKADGIAIISHVDCKLRGLGFVLCEGGKAEQQQTKAKADSFIISSEAKHSAGWSQLLQRVFASHLENLCEEDNAVVVEA